MLYIIKDFYIMIFILNGTKEHCNIIIIICKKKIANQYQNEYYKC